MEPPPKERDGLEFCRTFHPGRETIDYNNHVNVGYYGILFEQAAQAVFPRFDLSGDYKARTNHALFATESHVVFKKEIFESQAVDVYLRMVDLTDKALHVMFLMLLRDDPDPAATQEVLYLHVSLTDRKVVPLEAKTLATLEDLKARQQRFPLRLPVGQAIGLRRGRRG
ncbi:MAG TPA: thioesterase family protein [Stellaceae bacterium]|nr:thioesterase family protein [Stellaceae bacterium]